MEILYGANIPRLAKTIQEQLELETKYSEGKVERKFYEFDEPLPFERPEIERKRAEEEVVVQLYLVNLKSTIINL